MDICVSLFELSTFGTVLLHPQDEILSWGFSRRGPPAPHFIAMLACQVAALGYGLSCPEYDELVQVKQYIKHAMYSTEDYIFIMHNHSS